MENIIVVGAPCGIMDQMASYYGSEDTLVEINCQTAEVNDYISLPEPLRFVGIDSGVRRAVGGNSYGLVRTASFMGLSLLAQLAPELIGKGAKPWVDICAMLI